MRNFSAAFFMLALLIISLVGCRGNGDPLSYQNGELSADIIICKNGSSVSGKLWLGARADGAPRDATLVLTAPVSVKGIKIERIGGEIHADVGGYGFDAHRDLLFVAELFSLDENIVSAETATLDGIAVTKLQVSATVGDVMVWLAEDGTPIKFETDGMEVLIRLKQTNR